MANLLFRGGRTIEPVSSLARTLVNSESNAGRILEERDTNLKYHDSPSRILLVKRLGES